MAKFESGVRSYTFGIGLVANPFPVDDRGIPHECCEECFFYREASKTCGLDHKPVLNPARYCGDTCLLNKVTEEQYFAIINAVEDIIGGKDEKR